jgi:hypothetical protein
MRKLYLLVLIAIVTASLLSFFSKPTFSDRGRLGLIIEEADGSPTGYIYKLIVSNGTLQSITSSIGTVNLGSSPIYTALTGGGAGALDALTVVGIVDGQNATVIDSSGPTIYWYRFNNTATDAESSPNRIRPDDYATEGEGVWYMLFKANADSATPTLGFTDSDGDFDDHGQITLNCTDTGAATEDCDIDIKVRQAGSLVTPIGIDADGGAGGIAKVTLTGDLVVTNNMVIGDAKTIGSASDPDAISIGATGIVATSQPLFPNGGIASLSPIADTAANFAANFTGANLYGGTFICNAAGTLQLPAVGVGMNFTIITLGAIAVSADTNINDLMILDGTALNDGDKATNLSTAGDIIVFQYYDATGWVATSNGWTDGGP